MKIWCCSPGEEAPELVTPCVICDQQEAGASGVCMSCDLECEDFAAFVASAVDQPRRMPMQSERFLERKVA